MPKLFTFARLKLPIELQTPLTEAYKQWATKQIIEGKKHSHIEFVRFIINFYLENK